MELIKDTLLFPTGALASRHLPSQFPRALWTRVHGGVLHLLCPQGKFMVSQAFSDIYYKKSTCTWYLSKACRELQRCFRTPDRLKKRSENSSAQVQVNISTMSVRLHVPSPKLLHRYKKKFSCGIKWISIIRKNVDIEDHNLFQFLYTGFWWGNLNKMYHLEDPDVDGNCKEKWWDCVEWVHLAYDSNH